MSDIFFGETAFLSMITGTTPLSSSRLWISMAAFLATRSSLDCTKTVFIGWKYKAFSVKITCIWYCNNNNTQIVCCKSGTSPTCPNLSPRCPNKFFRSGPSGITRCWLNLSISTRSRNYRFYWDLRLSDHASVKHPFRQNCSRHFAK